MAKSTSVLEYISRRISFYSKVSGNYFPLLLGHLIFILSGKIILLSAIIYFFEDTKSLEFLIIISLYGYLPALVILWCLIPFLRFLRIKTTLILTSVLMIFGVLLLAHISTSLKSYLHSSVATLCLILIFSNVENVMFDRLCSLFKKPIQKKIAISLNRQANYIGYFLSPIITGCFLSFLTFQQLLLVQILFILPLIFFTYTSKICDVFPSTRSLAEFDVKEAIISKFDYIFYYFLFTLSFIWLNIVNVSAIPFLKLSFSNIDVGILLSLSGFGGVLGNGIFFNKNQLNKVFHSNYTFAYLTALSVIVLGWINISFILLGLIFFIGGFCSSYCFACAQHFFQDNINQNKLTKVFMIRNILSSLTIILITLMTGFLSTPILTNLASHFTTDFGLEKAFFFFFTLIGSSSFIMLIVLKHRKTF